MKPNNAIEVQGLSKNYKLFRSPIGRIKEFLHPNNKKFHNTFCALNDVSFEVEKGMTFGIVGQNGSGKSTLLQLISGIIRPTSGSVEVQGRISALLELGAGFHREFTGRENVYLQGTIMGIPRQEMDKHFHLIEEFADIGKFLDQPVKTYSSGMYIRLAFATAINVNPDILIVDEVLAVGDDMFQRRCYRKIEEFQEQNKTILFVSHNIETVTSLCNSALLLDRGEILEIGQPKTIANIYSKLLSEREGEYLKHQTSSNFKTDMDQRFKDLKSTNESEFRYGSADAVISDVKIYNNDGESVNVLQQGEECTIKVSIIFNKPMDKPGLGFKVRTLNGVDICGTNTFLADTPIGNVEPGTVTTISFSQKMILNPGTYTLTAGVAEDISKQIIFHDRRLDVLIFKVLGTPASIGLVNIMSNIKIDTKSETS